MCPIALSASVPAMNAYDKGGIKIVIHFGRDNPKPHVIVMVVSIMSMNMSPVKNLEFQAAVPKVSSSQSSGMP
jgi:hypothetical protein